MQKHFFRLFIFAALLAPALAYGQYPRLEAPIPLPRPTYDTIHGKVLKDEYAWLENQDLREVRKHLKAENRYTRKFMKTLRPLEKQLYREFVNRVEESDTTLPYNFRGYQYYERYEPGKNYEIIYRKNLALSEEEREEEVVLDVNKLARSYDYYEVVQFEVSPNNQFLAFLEDSQGDENNTLRFKDLVTRAFLSRTIEGVASVAWGGDNLSVFYTTTDSSGRSYRLWKHHLTDDPRNDTLLFEEKDPRFSLDVYLDKSEAYLFMESASSTSSEIHYLPVDSVDQAFRPFRRREPDHLYYLAYFNDYFYILSNKNAPNFKLLKIQVSRPDPSEWEQVISHRATILLEDFEIFNEYLVWVEKESGLGQIRIKRWDDPEIRSIPFDDATYSVYLEDNPDFYTQKLRYVYESFIRPPTTYEYNMENEDIEILKKTPVRGGFDPENYQVERLFAPARDGVEVPISLVYRKDLKKDGRNPLYLDGYGAYGYSNEAYFNPDVLSLLDRGVIFAIAHVRGGLELGWQWYQQGRLLEKKNTFWDFIDCSEFLIREKYTSPALLIAYGASAGGMLMGYIANERPELYGAIVLDVPFVDVVNTMTNPKLPLTTSEYEEWGNPDYETYFNYMLSYSPYDNIKAQDYPPMLFISAINDARVGYWEPAKMVARLRRLKTDKNPILMQVDMGSGHGGASGRYDRWREVAFLYTYMLKQWGLEE